MKTSSFHFCCGKACQKGLTDYLCTKKMQRILLIDNYDSFTYNLVQLLNESGVDLEVVVVKNDQSPNEIGLAFDKLIISPGPGLPEESGKLMEIIDFYVNKMPVLGVCLGHQALAQHFGVSLKRLPQSMHGQRSKLRIIDSADQFFKGIPAENYCGRYHSWIVEANSMPDFLRPTAFDESGNIMAYKHLHSNVYAVQFHPESYMTDWGLQMIRNWLTTHISG